MNEVMNAWSTNHMRRQDQREVRLPPTWMARANTDPARAERGQRVHQTGRNRVVARLIVNLVDSAKAKVAVSSFLLADAQIEQCLLDASRRGVRVYVMLATEARLGREPGEGEFDRRVLSEHKQMLARLAGSVLFRSASHFHAKVVLIDPDDAPAGILLTANLTKEALERNEEIAVELTPSEVREAALLARWAMWEAAEHEVVAPDERLAAAKSVGQCRHPPEGNAIKATTLQTNALQTRALALIDGAQHRLLVSSFGWDEDQLVVQRLCARARNGVDVTVLARVRASSMPALLALAQAGAKVLGFDWLHAKAIWSDSSEALVMSANLQADGLDRGFEMGVSLTDERAAEVRRVLEGWCLRAPWELQAAPALGCIIGTAKVWQDKQFTEVTVSEMQEVALGVTKAVSADDLTSPMPALVPIGDLPRPAHELHCIWRVEAPLLASKATEVRRPTDDEKRQAHPYSPPVYREPNGRLVVAVRSPDEMAAAQAVKAESGAAAIVVIRGTAAP